MSDPFDIYPPLQPLRTGILLVNLGTPDALEVGAIRRYLREFLSDPRVVELPRALWLPILYLYVLTTRPAKVRHAYAAVWTEQGSPLRAYSLQQLAGLRAELARRGHDLTVELAMRYGNPSLRSGLDRLREQGCERILAVPLYPQYSASTTATVIDEIGRQLATFRDQPEMRFIKRFHVEDGYIDALANSVREFWQAHGEPEKLVMSFHGLPRAVVEKGDPYFRDCMQTANQLAARLGLPRERWLATFQSRFGRTPWIEPYTEPTLRDMARQGVRRVDVMCPGFVAECIETLEEIAMGVREAFIEEGGEDLRYIPALNARPDWIGGLADLVEKNIRGWA